MNNRLGSKIGILRKSRKLYLRQVASMIGTYVAQLSKMKKGYEKWKMKKG